MPEEWSPRLPPGRLEELRNEVMAWLKKHRLSHDAHVYTFPEWHRRNEKYGNDAILTITAEGPFYQVMNYPESKRDIQLVEKFRDFLDKLGLWSEQGYAWTWHIYEKESTIHLGAKGSSLISVLGAIEYLRPRTVFQQGELTFTVQRLVDLVRNNIRKSGDARAALQAPIYSSGDDSEGKIVIWRESSEGPKATFVEEGSKVRTE